VGVQLLQLLLHGANLSAITIEGDTVLSLAVSENTKNVVKMIKTRKVEGNKLFLAIMNLDLPCVSQLIVENADVDQTDAYGETPLMYVAQSKSPAMQKKCIRCDEEATGCQRKSTGRGK